MQTKKLKINSDFVAGYKKGDIVNVSMDSNNVAIDSFWRQRLKDAQHDNCCEFIEEKKIKKEIKKNDN